MSRKMLKLSEADLLQTLDKDLTTAFPFDQYGLTREELRMKKKQGSLSEDREQRKSKYSIADLKKKYELALKAIEALEADRTKILDLKGTVETYTIAPRKSGGKSEATAVWVASDWHTDELIDPGTVNGLNSFNPTIAQKRVNNFFTSGLRLTNILAQDVEIKTIVLALLGDFFTGHIHPDFMELTDTEPIHAVIRAQNMIASGIQYILDNSTYDLVIPCHSGNHARTTEKTRFATENGHSLEFYMYHFLADHFKDKPRVKFLLSTGYMSYMDIYGYRIRFMHGHALRYGGGIGGIFIPAFKAISQWDKSQRADLTVFGHFHQSKDGGNFICNGSLIGYSAFALSIKADYEKPKQTLFLVDKDRGRTCVWPILVG